MPFGGEKIKNTGVISFVLVLVAVGVANSATTTATYQVSAGADDGYAISAISQNTSNPYLIIGNGRAFNAPYYMSAMRFNNIDIPRGATIVDARLKISSRTTDFRGRVYGVIYAEAADNVSNFSSRLIASANLTTASVNWDHKVAWSVNTFYTSDDISSVVQEVVNRSGWNSGNSIAIHYRTRLDSNKLRGIASYEYNPTSAAVLEITYEYCKISGTIMKHNPEPFQSHLFEGVYVTPSDGVEEVRTNENGYYELKVPPGWSGRVTPSRYDYFFNPHHRRYTNVSEDITDHDYITTDGISITNTYSTAVRYNSAYCESDWQQRTGTTHLRVGYSRSLPYMMLATRFSEIKIPANAIITDARLHLTSYNDYSSSCCQVYGELFTEEVDNAEDFSNRRIDNIYAYRTINWDHTGWWVTDWVYTSPDISELIDRVTRRSGWAWDNAIVVVYRTRIASGGSRSVYNTATQPEKKPALEITCRYIPTIRISGRIEDESGASVEGVAVTADNDGGATTTDLNGYYEIWVADGWNGTITFSKGLWVIPTANYIGLSEDQYNQDIVAYKPRIISGNILTDESVATEGVVVSADNGGTSDATDANGYYEVEVSYDWSGTLTPVKSGWVFDPNFYSYTNVTSDTSGQDFTSFQPLISGYIIDTEGFGVSGVVVSTNSGGFTGTTDANGYYELSVAYNWSGTVIASKLNWIFDPVNLSYSDLTTDQTDQNYTAYELPIVSGHVKNSEEVGVEGVVVIADSNGGADITDANGYYEIVLPYLWSGTITPGKTGWGFIPSDKSYSNLITHQSNQDYTAYPPPVISGYITNDGNGLEGFSVSADNGGGSGVTDSNGYYEVTVYYDWSGTITPSKDSWSIFPTEKTYSNVIADVSDENYLAYIKPKISGHVRDSNSVGIEGVLLSADNGGGSDLTNANGFYEFEVEYNWSGRVTASKAGWVIVPEYNDYLNVISDQINQDYNVIKAYGGGRGTAIEPYLIYDANQMNAIGANPADWDAHYELMADVNLSNFDGLEGRDIFNMIGNDTVKFSGIFDGNDHIISGFYYNFSATSNVGLFGFTDSIAELKNIILKNVNINVNTYQVGSLVGQNYGTITDCYAYDVDVLGGRYHVGGLVGRNLGIITNCYSSGSVLGVINVGGIAGNNTNIISESYSSANARAEGEYEGHVYYYAEDVGGLVGTNSGGAHIVNCYATGSAIGRYDIGGLVGTNNGEILNCYSVGPISSWSEDYGGLVAKNNGVVTGSFWDIETSNRTKSYGGTGLTTVEMQLKNNFITAGWDFENIWGICDNYTYPRLHTENLLGFELSSNSLSFTALLDRPDPNSQTLSIGNTFYGTLHWEIDFNDVNNVCSWLDFDPNIGITTHDANNIDVSVNTSGLLQGNYDCTLIISGPNVLNSPQAVDVQLEILGPSLSISTNEFNFQASKETLNPSPQTLIISNLTGGGTLNWSITADCNWMIIEPSVGAITTGSTDIILDIDQNNIEYGNHTCQLIVDALNANNSPQYVDVILDVLRPRIIFTPRIFHFETWLDEPNEVGQILAIENIGYDTLHWDINVPDEYSWLKASAYSGQTDANEVNEVILSIDHNEAEAGYYEFQITVSDPNAEFSPMHVFIVARVSMSKGERHVPAEYDTIQAAIDAAVDGDEVILEPGKYTGVGNGYIYINNKAITLRSIDPTNPDIVAKTIVDGTGTANPWGYDIPAAGIYTANVSEPNSVIIDGLTVTNFHGAGIICSYGNPVIQNCRIVDNHGLPWNYGGGVMFLDSNSTISNCVITGNGGGEVGSAGISIHNFELSGESLINNCIISNNYSPYSFGGGINCLGANITINNCTVANNMALNYFGEANFESYKGRGVIIQNSNVTINNSIIWDNIDSDEPPILILDFSVPWSLPIPAEVFISYSDIKGDQENIVIAPDEDSFYAYIYEGIPIDQNLIDPNVLDWSTGNIDTDPLFAEPGYWHPNDTPGDVNDDFWVNGDYHLKSQNGRWKPSIYIGLDPTGDGFIDLSDFAAFAGSWQKKGWAIPADLDNSGVVDLVDLQLLLDNYLAYYPPGEWVFDDITSPCIDTGDPNSDWTAELWPHGKHINIGAYGGTPQASMSSSTVGNKADLNNDGIVDMGDLLTLVDMWLTRDGPLAEDINHNGLVNFSDFAEFAGQWLWEE